MDCFSCTIKTAFSPLFTSEVHHVLHRNMRTGFIDFVTLGLFSTRTMVVISETTLLPMMCAAFESQIHMHRHPSPHISIH